MEMDDPLCPYLPLIPSTSSVPCTFNTCPFLSTAAPACLCLLLSAHTRTSHPPTHPSHKSSSTPLPLYFHKNAPPPLPSPAHLRASASRLISDGANVAGREVKGCRWKCQTNPGGTRRCLCALFCNIVSIPPLISTPSAPFTLKANLLTLSVLLPLYFFALPYSNLYF